MQKPSTNSILISSILLLSLANLGVSIFQITKSNPSIKYVNSDDIVSPLILQARKTVEELIKPQIDQAKVLSEQINNLELKQKTKGYLGSSEKQILEQKKKQREALIKSLTKKTNQQLSEMVQNKIAKANEILEEMAKKYNYTIKPTTTSNSILDLKATIAKKDDLTNLVLSKLGLAPKQKDPS